MIQRTPLVPALALPSSPTMPSSGRAWSSADTISCSEARSISDTMSVAVDLVSTVMRARPDPSSSRSTARRATSLASSRSALACALSTALRSVMDGDGTVPRMAASAPLVDLRSDTVTRPSRAMRRAMAEAEVGDDGFGDDPTVNRLQDVFAERTGKEAALFVPSGTMANQIALRVLAPAGSLVVAGRRQHVVTHEGGAFGVNQSGQLHVVDDDDGTLDPGEIAHLVAGSEHRWPPPGAVVAENTHLASGGRPWPPGRLEDVAAVGVPVHLDGARLFNAAVATGVAAARLPTPPPTPPPPPSQGP